MGTSKILIDGAGIDLTADTVAANKMLAGTTAHDANGDSVTGTIPAKSSSDLTVSGATVSVPAGNYASGASKSVASGSVTVATPTVNSSGLVTASATVSAGYVSGNPTSKTLQLTTQGAQTINPSLSAQTIAGGKYLTGAQTIAAITSSLLAGLDADFVAGNIKKDVDLFGLVGTFEGGGGGGAKVAYGSVTVSTDTMMPNRLDSFYVEHGLGVVPNFWVYFTTAYSASNDFLFAFEAQPNDRYDTVHNYHVAYVSGYSYQFGTTVRNVSNVATSTRLGLCGVNDSTKIKAGRTIYWVCGYVPV